MKRDRELVEKIYEVFPEVYQRGGILCNMFNAPFGILRDEELLANYTYYSYMGHLANLPIWGPQQDQPPTDIAGSVCAQKVHLALANRLYQVIEGTELKQVWNEWRLLDGFPTDLAVANATLFLAFITRFCERGGIILGKDMRRHNIAYASQRYCSPDYSMYNLDLAVDTRACRALSSHHAIDLLCAISPNGAENLIAKGKWARCFVTGKPINPQDCTACYLVEGRLASQKRARRDEFVERYVNTGQYFFDCIAEVYYNLEGFERVWLEDRDGCAWEGNAFWHEDDEGWYSYEQEGNNEDDDYGDSSAIGGYHGTRRNTREVRAYQLGIENEVKFGSYTSRRDAVKKIKALGGLLCERDGSLCDETGVEIVQLKPAPLEDTKSLWSEALKVIPPQRYAGYGMHINICTSDWSEDQLANFVGFWSINDDFVRYLSRRDYGHYCNQAAPHSVSIKDKLVNSYTKYRACAVFPDQMRAEVRIFRGTHIHELLCARAELVDAVARWSAGIPTTADAVSYINGAGESLLEYMKQDEGKYGSAIKAVRNWVRLRTRQDKCTKTGTSDVVKALINKPEPPPPAPPPPGEIPVDRPSQDPYCAANIYNGTPPPSCIRNEYWLTPDDGMAWPGVPEINGQGYMLCGNYAAYFDTYMRDPVAGRRSTCVERAYGVLDGADRSSVATHRIYLNMVSSPGRWEDSGFRYNDTRLYVWMPDQPAQPVLVEASDDEWDPFAEDES